MQKETINIYCDESCHLENDGINIMGLGCIWCNKKDLYQINLDIKNIKIKYNLKPMSEIKWGLLSNINYKMYHEIINYFFNNDKIFYRGYFIHKSQLEHKKYHQTHEDFYYKCYFGLLKNIFNSLNTYNIYVDIKDCHTSKRCKKLEEICCKANYDYSHELINKIQPIQSEESQLLQIADIITGAICYYNRIDKENLRSKAKKDLIELIKKNSNLSLTKKTYPSEKKFNLFFLGDYDEYE